MTSTAVYRIDQVRRERETLEGILPTPVGMMTPLRVVNKFT